MIKRWKEYSFILCLGISGILIFLAQYTGVFQKAFEKEADSYNFLEQNQTFSETNDKEEIEEKLEHLVENITGGVQIGLWENDVTINKKEKQGLTEDKKAENSTTEDKEEENSAIEDKEENGSSENEKVEKSNTKDESSPISYPVKDNMKEEKRQEILERQKEQEIIRKRKEKVPVFFTSDSSYFDDALFIGDSRTEGLKEYGNLGKATVLSDSGMSVYRLWKEDFNVEGKKQKLDQILLEKKFGKVYLMLGVNELGYDFGQTMKKYRETLSHIEETQPEAFIFLQANLHVTNEKAKNSEIYNNKNIDQMNQYLEELASERGYIYLDVNPLFDDESGSLSKEYTVDQAHILGKYYTDWVNWILEHCAK